MGASFFVAAGIQHFSMTVDRKWDFESEAVASYGFSG